MTLADNATTLYYTVYTLTFISCSILVVATWRSKELRSPCNLLIGFESLIYALTQPIGYAYFLAIQPIFGPISFANCFWVCFPSIIIFEMGTILPASIALERLLSVLYPVWAQHRSSLKFAMLLSSPAIFWAIAILLYFGIIIITQMPDRQVTCNPTFLYSTSFGICVGFMKLWLIPFCWGCYVAIWLVLRLRTDHSMLALATLSSGGQESFKRLTRSLVVVITLITFELAVPLLISYCYPVFQIPQEVFLGTLVPISRTIKEMALFLTTPALYFYSTEYHDAMKQQFSWFLTFINRFKKINAVQPSIHHPRTLTLTRNTVVNNRQPSSAVPIV